MPPPASLPLLILLAGPVLATMALAQGGAPPQQPASPRTEAGRPADQPPSLRPRRDVAVTYRVSGAGPEAKEMRVAWMAAPGLTRMEPPGAPGWILVEREPARATLVVDSDRSFLRLPPEMAAGMSLDVPPGVSLTRAGEGRVAGEPCTEWQGGAGQRRIRLCVTEDGVMLRMASPLPQGGENRMEAVSVRYAPQDPARFRVPAGYRESRAPAPLVPQRR